MRSAEEELIPARSVPAPTAEEAIPAIPGAAGKNRSRPAAAPVRTGVVRPFVPADTAWSTTLVQTTDAFGALEPEWSALLDECAAANVFLSHEWLHSWWTAYRPAAELALVVLRARGRVRAIAPLMIETRRRGGLACRVLRFVGDGTGETDHVGFVLARADRAATLPRLLAAIDALDWDVAEFNQVPEGSETADALRDWAERQRLRPAVERAPCPVRRLPARFDDVLASLPSRLRTSVRSSTKKLQQKHAVGLGLVTEEDELPAALETFFANHASRWQGKGQAGAFADARRCAFYARLSPRLLRRGWLRFYALTLDGRAVAQQYCFAVDGTVMLLQEGFDFAHATDNVGNVLRAKVFEHLIASGAACYDFLAGTSRHKQSWSDGVVYDLRIRCGRRSLKGWLFHAVPCHVERAKDALRPWRDRLRRRARDESSAAAVAPSKGEPS